MATAESVINKINGLIATANAKTGRSDAELTSAVNALVDGYGQGGGGIIDVEALPGEYYDIECYANFPAEIGGGYYTMAQLIQDTGATSTPIYYVVDTLPTDAKTTDFVGMSEVHCYIYNDIPYFYGDAGYGNMWVTFADVLTQTNPDIVLPNKGFTNDITTETEAGIYVTYKVDNDPIDENAIYRITKEGGAEVFIVGQSGYATVSETFNVKTEIYVVETLPATLLPCVSGLFRLYVVESTGFVHLDAGDGVMTLGAMLKSLDSSATDRGWTDDIASETKHGAYCGRTAPTIKFYTYSNGTWDEYADRNVTDKERDEAVKEATESFVDYFAASTSKIVIKIPEGVTSIEHTIVSGNDWNNLKTIKFPKSLTKLNGCIVRDCKELKTVIFKGTLETCTISIFENCPKLTDIYVPWAEGELETGTWGAPDTVVFHYKADTENM